MIMGVLSERSHEMAPGLDELKLSNQTVTLALGS